MAIRERGGSFVVDVRRKGFTFRRQYPTKTQAAVVHKRVIEEANAGRDPNLLDHEVDAAKQAETLRFIVDTIYRETWKHDKSGEHSLALANVVLRWFGDETHPRDVTRAKVLEYVEHLENRKRSSATVNRHLSKISSILKWACEEDIIAKVPKLPWRKEGIGRVRFFSDGEMERILSHIAHLEDFTFYDMVVLAVDTGMRRGELQKLRSDHRRDDMVDIIGTKNGEDRTIYLTARAQEAFKRSVPFNLSADQIRYKWERVRALLGKDGDEDFVFHTLRHTCASRLVQKGMPLSHVQKWMGHREIKTTLRYAHLAPKDMEQLRNVLED